MLHSFSHVSLFVTLWTVACQAPLSMGFSRQEYWSGLPFPPQGYLHDPEIKLASIMFPALVGKFFTTSTTWEPPKKIYIYIYVGFPGGSAMKNQLANAGDMGSIPGSRRSPGEGIGNPLQYSYLENSMDSEA